MCWVKEIKQINDFLKLKANREVWGLSANGINMVILGKPVVKEHLKLLIASIFQDDPSVYEAYSLPDKALRTFNSCEEVLNYFNEVSERKGNLVYLSIHYPLTKGYIHEKKINLIPEKCDGAKVRFSTEGWGLIQFQLWLNDSRLTCDIGANSEKRATTWEVNYPYLKSPTLWNWKEVERQVRRLKRVLKKSA